MEQSPSWETVASSAGLEIPRILWKPNFHYRIHKSHPLVPIMKHISSAHVLPSYWLKIRFNGILPSTPRASQWSLSFRFPNQKFCFHFCLLHSPPYVQHAPSISSFLIGSPRVVFGEEYNSCSSLLCNFSNPFVSPFCAQISFPCTLLSNTFTLCSSLSMRDHVSYPYKTTGEIAVRYILMFMILGNKGLATLCFIIRRCQTPSLEANAFGGNERNSRVTRFICWSSRPTNCKIFYHQRVINHGTFRFVSFVCPVCLR